MYKQAMKQALEALEWADNCPSSLSRIRPAIAALRAAIEQMEKAEPAFKTNGSVLIAVGRNTCYESEWIDLYTHPAQQPEGWLRAIDEAMVSSPLGVADASDSYEVAKKKLNDLICWNVQVATDPAVNELMDTPVYLMKCTNCAHNTCMFYGEDRKPVYSICWLRKEMK